MGVFDDMADAEEVERIRPILSRQWPHDHDGRPVCPICGAVCNDTYLHAQWHLRNKR